MDKKAERAVRGESRMWAVGGLVVLSMESSYTAFFSPISSATRSLHMDGRRDIRDLTCRQTMPWLGQAWTRSVDM